jgi:NADH-quinone oxidoreductase subunit N
MTGTVMSTPLTITQTTMTPELFFQQLPYVLPELSLAIGALVIVLVGAFVGDKGARLVTWLCVATILAAGSMAVLHAPAEQVIVFSGSYAADAFSAYAKMIIALTAASALLLSIDFLAEKKLDKPEFPVLALLATLGMFIMVSAHDLIALYVGVEMQSLCLYVLAAYARDDAKSSEAGLKYFVLGALSSGLLLYGCSLVYGFTGSVRFDVIASQVQDHRSIGVIFGLVFILCGLAFKMSAAPFHMWTPDVYEGSPTAATAFFASAPKVAAAVLFARVCFEAFGPLQKDWQSIVIIMAILSMGIGALFALQQTNIKRLLAYSSIANMGYALVAIACGPIYGPKALLVFISIYAITSVGLFGVVLSMRTTDGQRPETIEALSGLSRSNPLLAAALTMLLFSVMGIPPLAGFWGKWEIFLATTATGLIPLLACLVAASVVSAFYYLRILKTVWFDAPRMAMMPVGASTTLTLTGATFVLAALTVVIGFIGSAAGWAGAGFH